MALIDKPGLYPSIGADIYHGDKDVCPSPSLSSSGARRLASKCPAIYWYERNNPPEPSEALDVGTAAHEWLLEGDTWPQRFQVLPPDFNGRTREGQALLRSIDESGKRPLKAGDFATIKAMVKALRADPLASAAFSNGRAEQSIYWKDEETGIWCRARPDWLPNEGRVLCDYKTARSVHPDDLRKAMVDYGLHQQAAWYCDAVKAIGLIEKPAFTFVFQEKTPPYLIQLATVEETTLQWGSVLNGYARRTFARCLETGQWPGYADDIITLDLPEWHRKRLEQAHEAGLFEVAQSPLTQAAE